MPEDLITFKAASTRQLKIVWLTIKAVAYFFKNDEAEQKGKMKEKNG